MDVTDWGAELFTATVDVIGGDCTIPDLPGTRSSPASFMTADPEEPRLMVCGGQDLGDQFSSCHQYEPALEPPAWTHHSPLHRARTGALAVTLAAGVYVLGGSRWNPETNDDETWSTSEILRPGSSMWEKGPGMHGGVGLKGSCAVAIINTTFLLIGGDGYSGSGSAVHEFSSLTGAWTQWPAGLSVPRKRHACSSYQGKVVVAGGVPGGDSLPGPVILDLVTRGGINGDVLDSTEILDLASQQIQTGGPMSTPRKSFGMYEIGYAGTRILMTFGSSNQGYVVAPPPILPGGGGGGGGSLGSGSSVEEKETLLQEWDPAAEVWKPAPAVMTRRHDFSAVTVEARHVCPQGKVLACSKD
jgi:hypothetical protein